MDKTGFGTEPLRDKAWQWYNKALQWYFTNKIQKYKRILLPKMPKVVYIESSIRLDRFEFT